MKYRSPSFLQLLQYIAVFLIVADAIALDNFSAAVAEVGAGATLFPPDLAPAAGDRALAPTVFLLSFFLMCLCNERERVVRRRKRAIESEFKVATIVSFNTNVVSDGHQCSFASLASGRHN